MAITILNVSQKRGLEYGRGKQIYQVIIENTILFEFEHIFEDGITKCFERAAIEAKKFEESEKQWRTQFLKEMIDEYIKDLNELKNKRLKK